MTRNCRWCGIEFTPKRRDSICCSRFHSQNHNKLGRARIDVAPPKVSGYPCCSHWAASGPLRAVCPQHQTSRKMRNEDLIWADSKRTFGAEDTNSDGDWLAAGFTIHASAREVAA